MELILSIIVWLLGTGCLVLISLIVDDEDNMSVLARDHVASCIYAHFAIWASLLAGEWKWFIANTVTAGLTFFVIAGINHFSTISLILPISASLLIFVIYILIIAICGPTEDIV